MKESELKKMSKEALVNKEKGTKLLMGIFIPIILLLSYFVIRDYLKMGEMDMSSLTITICSIGGLVSLFPELKKIKAELKNRD